MERLLTGTASPYPARRVFHFLHALGRRGLPPQVCAAGRTFRISRFVKHDFFAATGFYTDVSTGEPVVVKIGRTEPFFGLPSAWIGVWLTGRETRFYRRLADVPNVPALIGRFGRTGFVHAYVHGRPLETGLKVPDGFFDEWLGLIELLTQRGIGLVDTNKLENILLGDDGRPHLIDFQISYATSDLFGIWPAEPLLRIISETDRYHVLKHKARVRPDLLTPAEQMAVARRHWFIRLHRRLTGPYFAVRRRVFAYLRKHGRLMPEGSK